MLVSSRHRWAAIPVPDGVHELEGMSLPTADGGTEWVLVLRPRPDISLEQYDAEIERLRRKSGWGAGLECDEIDTGISARKTKSIAPRSRSPRRPTADSVSVTPSFTVVP
jgi:hypothetical protein